MNYFYSIVVNNPRKLAVVVFSFLLICLLVALSSANLINPNKLVRADDQVLTPINGFYPVELKSSDIDPQVTAVTSYQYPTEMLELVDTDTSLKERVETIRALEDKLRELEFTLERKREAQEQADAKKAELERQLQLEKERLEKEKSQVAAQVASQTGVTVKGAQTSQSTQNNQTTQNSQATQTSSSGTRATGISLGSRVTESNADKLDSYDNIIQDAIDRHTANNTFKLNVELVKAIMMQESGGNPKADNGFAKGIMQIEYTMVPSFIKYGKDYHGETWSENDRKDAYKCINFGVFILSGYIEYYDGDYLKAIQAYNYSSYSLDKLIAKYGDNWMENRIHMAAINNKAKYGDSKYVEHVLSWYPNPNGQ